ncbi:hypothetical protein H2248_002434 [Termitomyces sp. 'cryptogamus']|nr:hypothetical protein H2248_002434 [Termitomyces sp. 'cryptogamus']
MVSLTQVLWHAHVKMIPPHHRITPPVRKHNHTPRFLEEASRLGTSKERKRTNSRHMSSHIKLNLHHPHAHYLVQESNSASTSRWSKTKQLGNNKFCVYITMVKEYATRNELRFGHTAGLLLTPRHK